MHSMEHLTRKKWLEHLNKCANAQEEFRFFGEDVRIIKWEMRMSHTMKDAYCFWLSDGSKFEVLL